jgi:hypothetical protein
VGGVIVGSRNTLYKKIITTLFDQVLIVRYLMLLRAFVLT